MRSIVILISVFIFLITITSVYATEGIFEGSGSEGYDFNVSKTGGSLCNANSGHTLEIQNIGYYKDGLQYISMVWVNFYSDKKSQYNSYYWPVELKYGSNVIATGKSGYYYRSATNDYLIYYWFDMSTWNGSSIENLSGKVCLTVDGLGVNDMEPLNSDYTSYHTSKYGDPTVSSDKAIVCRLYDGYLYYIYPVITEGTAVVSYQFRNDYEYYNDGLLNYINVNRTTDIGVSSSKWIINNSDGVNLYGDSGFETELITFSSINNSVPYFITVYDLFGNEYTDTLLFISDNGYVICDDDQLDYGLPVTGTYLINNSDFVNNYYMITIEDDNGIFSWETLSTEAGDFSLVISGSERTGIMDVKLLECPRSGSESLVLSTDYIKLISVIYGNYTLTFDKSSYELGDTMYINYSIHDFYDGKLVLLNPSSVSMVEVLFEEGTYSDQYVLDSSNSNIIIGNWLSVLYGRTMVDQEYLELCSVNPIAVSTGDVYVTFGRDEYDVNNIMMLHLNTQTSGGILNFSVDGSSIHKITLGSTGSRDYLIDSSFFLDKILSYPATLTVKLTNNGNDDSDTVTVTNILNDSVVFSQEIYNIPIGARSGISVDFYIVSSDFADVKILDADGKRVNGQTNEEGNVFPVFGTLDYDVDHGVWAEGTWQAVIRYKDGSSIVFDTAEVNLIGKSGDDDPGSFIGEFTALAELAGFEGPVGKFILAVICIVIASVLMLMVKFPVQGVFCIDILLFFMFMMIDFIPILYLVLFGIVAGLMIFGFVFRKAG